MSPATRLTIQKMDSNHTDGTSAALPRVLTYKTPETSGNGGSVNRCHGFTVFSLTILCAGNRTQRDNCLHTRSLTCVGLETFHHQPRWIIITSKKRIEAVPRHTIKWRRRTSRFPKLGFSRFFLSLELLYYSTAFVPCKHQKVQFFIFLFFDFFQISQLLRRTQYSYSVLHS